MPNSGRPNAGPCSVSDGCTNRYRSSHTPRKLISAKSANVNGVILDFTQMSPQKGIRNTIRPTSIEIGRQSAHNRQNTKDVSSRRLPNQITSTWLNTR